MPSMDYCKFENTCLDMAQCLEHLKNNRPLPTEYELRGYTRLLEYCKDFVKESEYFLPKVDAMQYTEQ
jgi:hypothetical protein